MAELVLNKRDETTGKLHCMAKETAAAIIDKLSRSKDRRLHLHADWSTPPEFSSWLFTEIKKHALQCITCTDSIDTISVIRSFQEVGDIIELCLDKSAIIENKEELAKLPGLKYFIIVDSISKEGALYQDILKNLPPSSMVTLGISWQSRLSGPVPFDEEEYSSWSATTMALVETLSSQKSTTELACGIKLCMFNRKELAILPTKLIKWPLARCTRSYFFDVDGSLRPCMRLPSPDNGIFNHETELITASLAFEQKFAAYTGHCIEAEDFSCRSHKVGCCTTGCIAHRIDEWHSS